MLSIYYNPHSPTTGDKQTGKRGVRLSQNNLIDFPTVGNALRGIPRPADQRFSRGLERHGGRPYRRRGRRRWIRCLSALSLPAEMPTLAAATSAS